MRNLLLFLFSHRLLAIARWDAHFLLLRIRNYLTGQRRRVARFLESRAEPIFLNLGSGPRGIADGHWLNVDGFRQANVHFTVDLARPLPLPDSVLCGAFCEHVLEHFNLEDGQRLATEVHRVLRSGACFRIVVPDAEHIIKCYFDAPQALIAQRGAADETAMELVNSYFRQRYEHQFLYDWRTIEKMLRAAGFTEVAQSTYGQTRFLPALVLDDQKYAWESLYVEALKA